MKERLTPEEKQRLVARYQSGEPVRALCEEMGVSKSGFYEWIGLYRETPITFHIDHYTTRDGVFLLPILESFCNPRILICKNEKITLKVV